MFYNFYLQLEEQFQNFARKHPSYIGVKIGFDDKLTSENAYAFNVCEKIGCITSMMVKKETLERFKKSNNLDLKYVGAKGQKIEIKFNLNGFEKEFKKIENKS